MTGHYAILIPVKSPAIGKSRLGQLGDERRRELALAFALDVVKVARSIVDSHVLVVTSDPEVGDQVATERVRVVTDAGDLNASLRAAADVAAADHADAVPVALCADLPALSRRDLSLALAQVDRAAPSFVSDASGIGTTAYAAPYPAFDPAFGPGSAAAHRAAGATEISGDLRTLRLDVDDLASLEVARTLGVGAHTAEVLRRG